VCIYLVERVHTTLEICIFGICNYISVQYLVEHWQIHKCPFFSESVCLFVAKLGNTATEATTGC
jgi:hypothetical protein